MCTEEAGRGVEGGKGSRGQNTFRFQISDTVDHLFSSAIMWDCALRRPSSSLLPSDVLEHPV